MGNELAYLAQIRSDTIYLKALMARIASATGVTGATTQTVDFCCDMFDRPDSDSLGAYWGDTTGLWSLYGGVALPRGSVAAAQIPAIGQSVIPLSTAFSRPYLLSSAVSATGTESNSAVASTNLHAASYFSGLHQASIQNMYNARMAVTDFTIQVTFTVSKSAVRNSTFTPTSIVSPWAGALPVGTVNLSSVLPSIFGAAAGNTAGQYLGLSGAYINVPSVSSSGGSMAATDINGVPGNAVIPVASTVPAELFLSEFGNFGSAFTIVSPTVSLTNTAAQSTTTWGASASLTGMAETAYSGVGSIGGTYSSGFFLAGTNTTTPSGYAGGTSPITAGSNTLTIRFASTRAVATLNGVALYDQTTPLLLSRTKAGLAAYSWDMFTAAVLYGVTGYGIKSFKAYRNDMPEPPNQSGHGVYSFSAGTLSYGDKYHLIAADGSVVYNPLA